MLTMPFLVAADVEVRACAECAARLARHEATPLVNVGSPLPLILLCEHERQAEICDAADDEAGQ